MGDHGSGHEQCALDGRTAMDGLEDSFDYLTLPNIAGIAVNRVTSMPSYLRLPHLPYSSTRTP